MRGLWNEPNRIDNFTGRVAVLDELHKRLTGGSEVGLTQAVAGMGGVGKTSVAIEYALRHEKDYTAIFWFNAADPASLAADFSKMAKRFQTPGCDAETADELREGVLEFLKIEASRSGEKPCFLIYDNVNDLEQIKPYVPANFPGRTLYTARDSELIRSKFVLKLDLYTPNEARDYLMSALSLDANDPAAREEADALAKDLQYFPLALAQAAAYITTDSTRCTIAAYRSEYEQRRGELLAQGKVYSDYGLTVATTWEINFRQLENTPAGEFLNYCAFLAPDGILAELFREQADKFGLILAPKLQAIKNDKQFRELVKTALQLSLLGYQESIEKQDGKQLVFNMHRLVQEVIRTRLAGDNLLEEHLRNMMLVFEVVLSERDYLQREKHALLIPHLLACVETAERYGIGPEQSAKLLNLGAIYLDESGDYKGAEVLYNKALQTSRTSLPDGYPDTASILNNLAGLYRSQGRYIEAEPIFNHALQIYRASFPEGDPKIAMSLNNLAELYRNQGRYAEAELLYIEAHQISNAALSNNHPLIAAILNNLALLYNSQGNFTEAEHLYNEALAIGRATLRRDHPHIATRLNNPPHLLILKTTPISRKV